MRNLLLTMGYLLCACGGSSSGVVGEMESLAKAMCACTDQACVDETNAKLEAVTKKAKKKTKDSFSESDKKRLAKVLGQIGECQAKVTGSNPVNEYLSKSKATEAKMYLRKMSDGARMAFMTESIDPGSLGLTMGESKFPASSAGPIPDLIPALRNVPSSPDALLQVIAKAKGSCCKGEKGTCEPNPALWQVEPWKSLEFAIENPHYYTYEYKSDSDAKTYTVLAYGDLDCDGDYSTYSITGSVVDGEPSAGEITSEKPLE